MQCQDCNAITTQHCPEPLQIQRSNTGFGKHGFDLMFSGEFTGIGLCNAFVDVTNLPRLALHIVGQRINAQKLLVHTVALANSSICL